MSLADLQNYDDFQLWMRAVSETLSRSILFVTKPTDGGSADTGPFFRLKPSQVVGYELLTVSRHTAFDGNEGDGASRDLIRGAGTDLDNAAEFFTTVSGSIGVAHADANMRYLQDKVNGVTSDINVGHNDDTGTATDNVYTGIWVVAVSNPGLGDAPELAVEIHTHESLLEGGVLRSPALNTSDVSVAGTLLPDVLLNLTLEPNAFFPMIHMGNRTGHVVGNSVDGGDASAPRFGLLNTSGSNIVYAVDYRYILG